MANSKTQYTNNFGIVAGMRITSSRGTPVAFFTLKNGEKFSRDCVVYGKEKVDAMKAIGNGRKAWVRGEIVDMKQTNAAGGSFTVPMLKGFNLKDITDGNKAAAGDEAAAAAGEEAAADADAGVANEADAGVAAETAAEAKTRDLTDNIPF